MFNKMKKLIAVSLAAVMVFSMAACGEKPSGGEDTTPTPTPKNEADMTPIEKMDAYYANYPAFDMEGRTIKIAMFYDAYFDSNDTKPEDNPGLLDMEMGQQMLDNVRRIEKKYNCKIEYINPGSDALKTSLNTSVVAGTPDYDVYLTQMDWALPLAVNGYFIDLSTFNADYLDINNDQNIIKAFPVANTNCFFEKSAKNVTANYMAYNADMLEQLKLEDPLELYAKGEWTWEKFEELCIKATQDTDNNGEPDIYGYGGDLTMTLREFLASNNAVLVKEDGTEGLSDANSLETFQFLGKLYGEDKAARPIVDDWYDGIAGWINNKCVFGPTQMWILQTTEDINFNYRIVPWPKGPNGSAEVAGQGFNDYFAIPRGVKDPEKVYQIMEEFFGWFCGDTEFRDQDMISLAEGCFLEEADVDMAFEIGDWGNKDIWSVIDTDFLVASVFSGVVSGEFTPAQAVESVKQLFQDEIDAMMGE